ncbi:MAG: XisI protein [Microcoleus sp.]|uniref:XisI protein n=1 Tax=Microcoleus sp. TaxID=44472 RepID=UPI003C74C608
MDKLDEYRDLIYQILSYYANLPYRYGDISSYVIVSQDRNHFMLMHEGWQDRKRIHGAVVHVEIRNGKLWIHYDGIEDGITDELLEGGVPENCIVLAFHSPEVRKHTGFAIA